MNGLRVATVISGGVATIAAAIGAGGLGVFIFRGIATVNNGLLLAGALPAAAIALAADALLAALERQLSRSPQRQRRQRLAVAAALVGCTLLTVALAWQPQMGRQLASTVVIGSKGFTEQLLLGELVAQEIEAHTALQVKREFSLGSTFLCHEAVRQGRIDGYVEYTGTAWSAILKQPTGSEAGGRDRIWRQAAQLYDARFNLRMFPSLGFENTFALLIRRADGQRLGLRSISQAIAPARRWRAAFGYEFLNRSDGYPGLSRRYGLQFTAPPTAMELGLTYRALANGQVDLIAGDSTNGLIPALQLQMLQDDRHYFPPYEAVPVFNGTTLRRHPELVPVLESLAGRISATTMQSLNAAVDLEHRNPEDVVRRWRQDQAPPLGG
jgi:osmoprotectant transport system permease protein